MMPPKSLEPTAAALSAYDHCISLGLQRKWSGNGTASALSNDSTTPGGGDCPRAVAASAGLPNGQAAEKKRACEDNIRVIGFTQR